MDSKGLGGMTSGSLWLLEEWIEGGLCVWGRADGHVERDARTSGVSATAAVAPTTTPATAAVAVMGRAGTGGDTARGAGIEGETEGMMSSGCWASGDDCCCTLVGLIGGETNIVRSEPYPLSEGVGSTFDSDALLGGSGGGGSSLSTAGKS